jgi:hypothetical protein
MDSEDPVDSGLETLNLRVFALYIQVTCARSRTKSFRLGLYDGLGVGFR